MRVMEIAKEDGTLEGFRVPEEGDQNEDSIIIRRFTGSGVIIEDVKKQVPIMNKGSGTFGTEVDEQSMREGRFNPNPRVRKQRRTEEDGEDRFSTLPNDLIYHIFSSISTKSAVQTSVLSTRWKNVWKSLPILNLSEAYFDYFSDFSRFVINVISYRDYDSDVSTLNLYLPIHEDLLLINTVIGYAVAHNCQQLLVYRYFQDPPRRNRHLLIQHSYSFDCRSLKHLALYHVRNTTMSTWNLPALTSLILGNVSFQSWCQEAPAEGFFSEFPNLKDLTLIDCHARSKSLNLFKMSSNSIETLKIKSSVCSFKYEGCTAVISMPNLLSFQYEGCRPFCFSIDDSIRLEEVKICLCLAQMPQEKKQLAALEFTSMLHQFKNVKYLTFSVSPFRFLSMVLDLLICQPYPFPHVKHLRVDEEETLSTSPTFRNELAAVYANLMTYFRGSSPADAVIEYSYDSDNYIPDNAFMQADSWERSVSTHDDN